MKRITNFGCTLPLIHWFVICTRKLLQYCYQQASYLFLPLCEPLQTSMHCTAVPLPARFKQDNARGGNTAAGIAKQVITRRGHWRSLKRRHCREGGTTAGITKQDVAGMGHWRNLKRRHLGGGDAIAGIAK